jgi:hypothetical protein
MVVGLAVLALGGCGSREPAPAESAAGAAQQPAQGAAEGAAQVARGLEQMAQSAQNAQVMSLDQVKALLPEVSGWTRSNMRAQTAAFPFKLAVAEATYERDGMTVDLTITDTAFNQMAILPFQMFLAAGFEEQTETGYKKAINLNGMPGFEEWNSSDRSGEVLYVAGGRVIVNGKGREIANLDPIKAVVGAVPAVK